MLNRITFYLKNHECFMNLFFRGLQAVIPKIFYIYKMYFLIINIFQERP